MVTKRSLHHVASLQLADECKCDWKQCRESFLSFDAILIYADRDFNVNNCTQKWISRKCSFGEHGEYVFLQNSVAFYVCYLIAVGLTMWTYDFWGFPTVHRVYISSSAWREHSLCILQYAVEKMTKLHHPKADLTELYHPFDFGDAILS